jgi:hypothetical protein
VNKKIKMKNFKKELTEYLKVNGKSDDLSYRELYERYPFDGLYLSSKQQGDRVRSIWRSIKKSNITYCTISAKEVKISVENNSVDVPVNNNQPHTQGQYLILGCVHAPFVNHDFWNALCKYAEKNKDSIKGLILNGDFLDMNALSFHDKGSMPLEGYNLGREYSEAKDLLNRLLKCLNKNIYKGFMYGNHEHLYNRYMSLPDGKRIEGAMPKPEEGLALDKSWNIFTDWKNDEIQIGDLTIIHGEFFNVHLCKKYLDTFRKNILFAHSHRQQIHREGNDVAYNIGCMIDMNHPAFYYASKAMKKTWANGFAIATLDNTTNVELVTWNKDYFYYGGNKY